ncbi:FAD-dependent thymidylate synthase [Candidatus Woesearchaeota archaeon]|nr:FAD-dependent thymidylate synthase [Candidatus Woesearchaeota archaeon]
MVEFTKEEKEGIMLTFFTNLDKPTYFIQNLPEEFDATLKAYYSRSPNSLRDNFWEVITDKELGIADRLRKELDAGYSPYIAAMLAKEEMMSMKTVKRFHSKWTVKYGHGSVAEQAKGSACQEDLSIILTKVIEDDRLNSHVEISTRYQPFSRDNIAIPKCIENDAEMRKVYLNSVNLLFDTYEKATEEVRKWVEEKFPDLSESLKKNKTFDLVRCLLPACSKTSVGSSINARCLEKMISKMGSHPLEEAQDRAKALKDEALKVLPTLVKYAEPSKYRKVNREFLETIIETTNLFKDYDYDKVKLIHSEDESEAIDKIVSFLLFDRNRQGYSYSQIFNRVKEMPHDIKEGIITNFNTGRKRHDQLPRAFEMVDYTWECIIDFGAYRDLQRQRMCTQATPGLTNHLGFTYPNILKNLGLQDDIENALNQACLAYDIISKEHKYEAQYVLPLATNVRMLFKMNLRELDEVAPLRTSSRAHESYKNIILKVVDQIREAHPFLGSLLRTGDIE